MFRKIARSFAITLTVLGLAFGSVQVSNAFTADAVVADSAGQKGEWDAG
ncbi:MAG TPA: hypothetical protein VFF10_04780 [Trueperaceae bacterium]|nr:hypothetical protein [Trueperaceae bacterium]